MVVAADPIAQIRALTGITPDQISDDDLQTLLDLEDGLIYCAAADAADQMGTSMIGGAGVTSVEDIAIDRRRVITAWRDLADRLRERCDDEAEDAAGGGGPSVVEFDPRVFGWGVEATERGY